jgi:hypothetical protein
MPQFNHLNPMPPDALWNDIAEYKVVVFSQIGVGPNGKQGEKGEKGDKGDKGDPGDGNVIEAQAAAEQAAQAAQAANENAELAQSEAQRAADAATDALDSADSAAQAASIAISSAGLAMNGLSEVEKVLDTTNWIAEHGRYIMPSDPEYSYDFDPNQFYYVRTGSGTDEDPYVYTLVENPVEQDFENYYILVVDESVQAFVASKLVLLDDGLYIKSTNDDSGYKVRVASNAIDLIDDTGKPVTTIDQNGVQVGKSDELHVQVANNRFSFLDQNGDTIAYLEVDEETQQSALYVAKTIITKESQFGNWKWYERPNNNMALKWMGDDD